MEHKLSITDKLKIEIEKHKYSDEYRFWYGYYSVRKYTTILYLLNKLKNLTHDLWDSNPELTDYDLFDMVEHIRALADYIVERKNEESNVNV
jgi:hypothetical protein